MYRLLTPILAFIVAFTLFFTFIEPTFEEYKRIDVEVGDYEQALQSAQRLQERVNELIADKNAIAQSDMERLMTFLPNTIDEVGIVLTLDQLSSRHELALGEIGVQSSRSKKGGSAPAAASQATFAFEDEDDSLSKEETRADGTIVRKPTDSIETVMLTFSVTGTYENFKALLSELESSLTLMDVAQLSISEPKDDELATFRVSVALYQFKPEEQR
jgi:hypothetical protein